ncbi:MAG: DegV family protein [Anaerolineae bacterium]|jgi:DegV family protein with EDD domain|nr:DegV family protein [Anaerolineae bacterium]MDX9830080.1 DegV family protein [Anaerolineae bacterium]
MIKVATDSTCDLPEECYQEYDITVVPINIQFGTETYEDGVTIDRAAFYQKIEQTGKLPSTSQPSAGQFERHYRKMMAAGAQEILSLHVTAKLSGTFQSAELAREMLAGMVRVHPFDSACGSAGLGFMALEAARMIRKGQAMAEIMARMEVLRERMNIVLVLRDLRFAQMSGRVGRLQSSLASLLNVKPIVVLEKGVIDVSEKVRSQRKALERMLDIMAERVGTRDPVNLAVVHAESPEEGNALLETARSRFRCQQTFLANLTTSLVVHFGPGTLGLVAYRI